MQYLAFVQRDAAGNYLATLPDFPGCTATAPSWLRLDKALRYAVQLYMQTQSDPAPAPTPIEEFSEDSAPPDSCWMHVNLFVHELQPTGTGTTRETTQAPVARPRARKRKRALEAPLVPPRTAVLEAR